MTPTSVEPVNSKSGPGGTKDRVKQTLSLSYLTKDNVPNMTAKNLEGRGIRSQGLRAEDERTREIRQRKRLEKQFEEKPGESPRAVLKMEPLHILSHPPHFLFPLSPQWRTAPLSNRLPKSETWEPYI